MKLLAFISLLIAPVLLSAEPISVYVHGAILVVADQEGIPRSVANRQQIEESGNPITGEWGDAKAVGKEEAGKSLGLYQIYDRYLDYFLSMYWTREDGPFDVFDPVDNARLAFRIMKALHDQFGTWYLAACHYNAGPNVFVFTQKTRDYARRIVNAR